MKKYLYPSNFPPSHKEIPPIVLTVTLLVICISYVVDARKNDVTSSNVVESETSPSDLLQNKSLSLTIDNIGEEY